MGIFDRFQTLIFGAAIARAGSDAVGPVMEPVRQESWQANQIRVLDPGSLAELVAKGFGTSAAFADEASRSGISQNRLDALMAIRQSYPGLADLDKMSNRGILGPDAVRKVLSRHGIPKDYHGPLMQLFSDLLSPDQVANAIQQGHLPNQNVLPDIDTTQYFPPGFVEPLAPDTHPPSEVPLTQIQLDSVQEAAGGGIDLPRLQVLANLSGLPPPQAELLHMLQRGIIDEATFDAGIREGHTKTKWIGALKRLRWGVLSAAEYAGLHLKSWIDADAMYAGGALTGHTRAQMDLLYKNRGRTATPRQVWLAAARGVTAPDYPDEPANGRITGLHDHELAIARSDIRPEYAGMLWDIRYNYPSLFQLGRLVQSGAISPDQAAEWAGFNLEAPAVVDALKVYWQRIYPGAGGAGAGAGPSPVVKSQRTVATTAVRKAYVGGTLASQSALEQLAALAVSAADAQTILAIWDIIYQVENEQPPGTGGPH